MKKDYAHFYKKRCKRAVIFVLPFWLLLFSVYPLGAQKLIDSLNWSTRSGFPLLATDPNNLYVANVHEIGHKMGLTAFFPDGSNYPDAGMPVFTDGYGGTNLMQIYSAVGDGRGGWYVGGDFGRSNMEKTGPLAHILADKSIESPFINGINFGSTGAGFVYALQRDGDFLYVGGNFVVTDQNGKTYQSLFRVHLKSKTIDPTWDPFPEQQSGIIIYHIEVGKDKVFLSGNDLRPKNSTLPKTEIRKTGNSENFKSHFTGDLAVVDKITGKTIRAPYAKAIKFKLIGDTLLFSAYDFGYPANGLALLDTLSDTSFVHNLFGGLSQIIADGRGGWYVAGQIQKYNEYGIFHLNAQLKKDTAFQQKKFNGWYDVNVSQLLLKNNGLYVLSNREINEQGRNIQKIFRLDPKTGAIDTSFHPNPNGWNGVSAMAVKGDTLFVAGDFDSIAGHKQPHLAAIHLPDGEFISWTPAISSNINKLLIHNDTLYAGGYMNVPDHPKMFSLVRFDLKTGQTDTTFHVFQKYVNNFPNITDLAYAGNKLFFAGDFSLETDGQQINYIGFVDLHDNTLHRINNNLLFEGIYSLTPHLAVQNGIIYCSGFSVTDTGSRLSRKYFFAFRAKDGQLTSWNPNPNQQVSAFAIAGNRILLSGHFTFLKTLFVDGYPAWNNLAAIDVRDFHYIPILPPGNARNTDIQSLSYFNITADNRYIFLIGHMRHFGDSIVNGIIRLRRNGLKFAPLPHQPVFTTEKGYKTMPDNGIIGPKGLYLFGNFSSADTIPADRACLLDPETGRVKNWHPLLPAQLDFVYSADIFLQDSTILITSNQDPLWPSWKRYGMARIDLNTGKLTDWDPHLTDNYGNALYGAQQLDVRGDTVWVLYQQTNAILNNKDTGFLIPISAVTGQKISGFHPPKGTFYQFGGRFYTFCVTGNAVFVGGSFSQINENPINCVAKINKQTGKLESWPSPLSDGYVYALAEHNDTLYIGGHMLQVNGKNGYYNLISADARTGKVFHTFRMGDINDIGYFIQDIAINNNGEILMSGGHDEPTPSAVYSLHPRRRDTLILNKKIKAEAGYFTGIKAVGNIFFIAVNHITEHGKKTEKPGFICYNPENDTVYNRFAIPVLANEYGGIHSFAFNDKILAVTGLEGAFGKPSAGSITFMTTPDLHLKPGVTSWTPHKADNRNPFTVRIYGTGFGDSSTVALFAGDTLHTPDSLFVSGNKITAWFNGARFSLGDWNMKVRISALHDTVISKAVHIYKAKQADLWVKWVGPKVVYIHKPESFYMTIGNRGNTGAYGVFLYIAVDSTQSLLLPKEAQIPDIKFKNFNINLDTVEQYSKVDYFFGKPFHGKVYTLFIPYIPPDFEYGIHVYIRSDLHGITTDMRVAISQPLYESFDEMKENFKSANGLFSSFFHCVYDVASTVVELTPGIGCVKSVFDNFIYEGYNRYKTGRSFGWLAVGKSAGLVALDCAGGAEVRKGYKIASTLVQKGVGIQSSSSSCGNFFEHLFGNRTEVTAHASVDPNEKFGPGGINNCRYVPLGHPYQYMITFENDSAATAAAERVIIIDTLDKNVFDLSSFHAIGFGFGDTTYMFKQEDGDTVYIDLRPEKNTIVRVFYHLDNSSGVLRWVFQALDPDTYDYVSNVNDGFLPPNRKAPEGDGNILYSIQPVNGLADGTPINNSAHIVFDWNEEIPTETWKNVTDNTPPESVVNALPAKETDKDFTVSWQGSDAGSGVYSYTVFVSENDSAYYPWISTHDTLAVFSGKPGATYKFYTVATDSAGNVEKAPDIYDAITQVSGTGIERFGKGNRLQFRLFPNPASRQLHVGYYLPQTGNVRIEILNLCGVRVLPAVDKKGISGTDQINWNISVLPAGTYFVRIITRNATQIRKVVIR